MGSELWTEVEPSQFAHEREALDFVRRRFPDREPWRAWSNFTFVDEQGRATPSMRGHGASWQSDAPQKVGPSR